MISISYINTDKRVRKVNFLLDRRWLDFKSNVRTTSSIALAAAN